MSDDKHHRFWPDLISKAYVLGNLSVPTTGETCLPAVAALFIIKPGMFQCRTYNLGFNKARAQCCYTPPPPPPVTGMHLVLFCKEKGVSFDHKLAQALRNRCRWWLGFVKLFKKWVESMAFNLSIWTFPPPFRCEGGIPCAEHLSVPLAPMETRILPYIQTAP